MAWPARYQRGIEPTISLFELQNRLDLKVIPRLMCCFDISHIQGSDTVGSVVVFENGAPKKSGYRHMKIQGKWGNDDYRSMAECVSRYFRRALEEKNPLPDLVIIDGGKGQLGAALGALSELELHQVSVAALAKKEEEVFLDGRPKGIRLSRKKPCSSLTSAHPGRSSSVRHNLQQEAPVPTHAT